MAGAPPFPDQVLTPELPERRAKSRPNIPFVDHLSAFGGELALVGPDGGRVTYRNLGDRANRLADRLGRTRRLVFLEADSSVEAVVAYAACLLGRHPVFLYARQDREKVAALIDRYQPNVVFTGGASGTDCNWINDGTHDLHPDLSVLLSTSGSTGSPKLVKLSRRSIDANAHAIADYLPIDGTDRAMLTLPFSYSYGMSVVNSHLAYGAAVVLPARSVTEPAFWQTFREVGATSFAGVPYTFESLLRSGFSFQNVDTLRYATQAGGRLDPKVVAHFANLAGEQGWRFVVMYGQTEAAPRMAYLPPDRAREFPDCIGIPVPGGRLDLVDDDGREVLEVNTPGQLMYSGPNVMLGYAEQPADLATDETPARLVTGDVGCRNSAGLFYLVGRNTRFVKPFGIRVNLDDIEQRIRAWVSDAHCAGDDSRIVVVVRDGEQEPARAAVEAIATLTNLPGFIFQIAAAAEIPRLPTGKPDYAGLLALASTLAEKKETSQETLGGLTALRFVFSTRFIRSYVREMASILGLRARNWQSVTQIYQTLLATADVNAADSFRTLAGDSLSYVQVSAALTEHIGALPVDWPDLSVRELELAAMAKHSSTV